jgi:hypothetical protein
MSKSTLPHPPAGCGKLPANDPARTDLESELCGREDSQSDVALSITSAGHHNTSSGRKEGLRLLPFLIPHPNLNEGQKLVLPVKIIAYFFTSAAVDACLPFIDALWTRNFTGKPGRVYVMLRDGRWFDTGRASFEEVIRDFSGGVIRLSQSTLLNDCASSSVRLRGKAPFVGVLLHGKAEEDVLHVSRRFKASVQEAFGVRRRRR